MSYRNTPLSSMSAPRYLEWRAKRIREMRRERNIRWAAAVLIPGFAVIVAFVVVGYAWGWLS